MLDVHGGVCRSGEERGSGIAPILLVCVVSCEIWS